MLRFHAVSLLIIGLLPSGLKAGFSINFTFGGGITSSQQDIFNQAKATWESYLVGYQPGITRTGVNITASGSNIDGVGGIVGSAGPSAATSQAGYWLATSGTMMFDTADLAGMESEGLLDELITHEIAHVLGFGTLWDEDWNNLYTNGTGQYTGAFGLAAYRNEFDPLATFVPIELAGGAGTADGHLNENDSGLGQTGITDPYGRDMAQELMTGWIGDPGEEYYISQTTLGIMQDLGFAVAYAPEPAHASLLGLAALLLGLRRSRPSRRSVSKN